MTNELKDSLHEVKESRKPSFLYLVNFYGTPPLNYLEKYVRENELANFTIFKLPSVRPMKNRFLMESFVINSDGTRKDFNFSVWFPFPLFLVFAFQYFLNIIFLFVLLLKSDDKKFDVGIGETQFGSAVMYALKLLGIVKYSVYMNGDALPSLNSNKPFYFEISSGPNSDAGFGKKVAQKLLLKVDRFFIRIQYLLRSLGEKNDLVWYPSEICKKWDLDHGFENRDSIVSPTILLESEEVIKYSGYHRDGNVLAYIGRLDSNAGMDMSLQTVKEVKRQLPDIRLLVVGGGSLTVEKYKKMAEDLGIEANVEFFGYVPDMQDAQRLLLPAKLGLALYRPEADNVSLFSEPSKPKEYIKLGIPVLMTKGGPLVGSIIESKNAGLMGENDPKILADIVVRCLTDDILYKRLKSGVLDFSSELDYKKAFLPVLEKIARESGIRWA
ncbi:hypothetical protein A2619_04795 [candidate division WWE3 bacterium RIFOXYD1_FULL_39_9]|uniref:Glycosyl transferase family 1 domain-containing protein n=1 Tax=candidate division WWE3 bacterium RIFOXYD1_FULL_39_9 TaxID=1802649 RepID=A0A1F4X6N6_UNCKA|nr:MAG: hypothetical protein A2619_04795 [candidate division WWE3 bacterium RIFOXYD1_FULL_39_9]